MLNPPVQLTSTFKVFHIGKIFDSKPRLQNFFFWSSDVEIEDVILLFLRLRSTTL